MQLDDSQVTPESINSIISEEQRLIDAAALEGDSLLESGEQEMSESLENSRDSLNSLGKIGA